MPDGLPRSRTARESSAEAAGVASARPQPRPAIWLDWGERLLICLFYLAFAAAVAAAPSPVNLCVLASETLAVAFVLFRRKATTFSRRPADWTAALAATLSPLLLRPGGDPLAAPVSLGLALVGCILVAAAKLSLNRRLGMAPANRGIQTGGAYALIRHPMYLGYVTAQLGFLLQNPSLWNGGIVAAGWVLQLIRIRQEEAHLRADPAYEAYAARVRYRLIPGVY